MDWNLKVGDSVDGWTLNEKLGGGGNGEVWLAEHATFGQAALKLLKLRFQGQDHKRYLRFRDEATMHGQLAERHGGVLPFVGCSLPETPSQETPAWLATKVAQKAQEALKGQPLREAVEAVASIAETLAALHEQEVAHRDVKPDNLFRHEGRWVVGDFGLVDYPDKESLTDTGERLGPFHYLAPEMLNEANRADGRKADVFSLGKTLWVLATEQHIPPPGEIRAENPQLSIGAYCAAPRTHQLNLLVQRTTGHDPAGRPTMAEFAAELRAWLTPPSRPVAPTDLAGLAARLTALTAPIRREAAARMERDEEFRRLGDRLEEEMAPLTAAIINALGPSGGRAPPISRQDGNVHRALPPDESLSTSRVVRSDMRTLAAFLNARVSLSLYSGFGLELYESGRLRVFGGHVVRQNGGRFELVWSVVRVVWPHSAEMERAFCEVISGLNDNLRLAVERLVGLLEAEVGDAG
jgi:hypothetical protein